MSRLRHRINLNCKACGFDELAAGTWRQQITLCPVKSCSLYAVRPVTKAPIPTKVLDYYQVSEEEYREIIGQKPEETSDE